jgi:acetyl esterase/lipase
MSLPRSFPLLRFLSMLLFLGCLWRPTLLAEPMPYQRTRDILYGRVDGTALTLDLFKPERPNGLGVIYVMSGGWYSSHEFIGPKIVQPLLDHGYTVFAVVHGSNPRYTIREIVPQMERSVRFIRHHAKEYGVDPTRLGVAGGSAGAHLSLMLATRGGPGNADAKDPVDRESSAVQAAAGFFPPTDFLNYGKPGESAVGEGILKDFRSAFGEVPKDPEAKRRFAESISPIYHVRSGVPPVFLLVGDQDKLVPMQQSELFLERVKAAGGVGEIEVRPGQGHGWKDWENDVERFAVWFDRHLRKLER